MLGGHSREKGEVAAAEIIRTSDNEAVTFLQADLSLVREMQRAAAHIRQTFDRLDMLVHGAGGLFPHQRTLTAEGVEFSFALIMALYELLVRRFDVVRFFFGMRPKKPSAIPVSRREGIAA